MSLVMRVVMILTGAELSYATNGLKMMTITVGLTCLGYFK